MSEPTSTRAVRQPLGEIFRTFLIYGIIGFGGPAAHLAIFERDLVTRRNWLSRQHFLNLLAAINLVPGPNSTEMAFHIGLVTGGLWGCVLAGIGFIVPAVLLSLVLAVIYVEFGSVPTVQGILLGVKPIILVLILSAAYRLGQKALDNTPMRVLFGLALVAIAFTLVPLATLLGFPPAQFPELALLLGTGFLYMLWRRGAVQVGMILLPVITWAVQIGEVIKPTVLDLFARFFLIGATLFGSGYVLASYMEREFVASTGWLTPQQLLDTLAIGQSTPGPVLSTSAAAGYVMTAVPGNIAAGVPGAILSAVGVFLPAFVIVLLLGRVIPIVQKYRTITDFLKGVNAGVIALLVGTFINLAWGTLIRPENIGGGVDWISGVFVVGAFFASEQLKWTPLRLVLIGIGVGILRSALGWL
ncbi:MAG: chromate efflux transporter [Anaerolineae bacterium]